MLKSGIAGSYGSFIPSVLRTLYTVLLRGSTDLYSHQQCSKVSFSLYPLHHLLFEVFVGFFSFFDHGHSDWCELISHCSFDLHFSNNEQRRNGDAEAEK